MDTMTTLDLDALHAELIETLQGIVNANWRDWAELASPEEFERWAKARASHAIDGLRKAEVVREGWKLVPTAATPEWVENLERKHGDPDACEMSSEAIAACINELLAAAPTSSDSEGAKG